MFFEIGDFTFTGPVDATDPCYSRETYTTQSWCGTANIPLVPGAYTGFADMSDEGSWGRRCARLVVAPAGAVKGGTVDDYLRKLEAEEYGEVGVDAGVAGIFQNKPDFGDEGELSWSYFCDSEIDLTNAYWVTTWGFCTSSGYGDGGYPLYAYRDGSGNIVALEIVYIDDEADGE